jgi:hypothetical protein
MGRGQGIISGAYQSGRYKTEAETQRCRQKKDQRRHEKTLGVKTG